MENLLYWLVIFVEFLIIIFLMYYSWKKHEQAKRDFLTGLFNRSFLSNTLCDFLEKEGVFAVVMIDIDNFKLINDSLGHVVGDKILKSASSRIIGNIRPSDIAFRYGGEEFTVILPEVSKQGAVEVCERLQKKMRKTYRLESSPSKEVNLKVTVSMGGTMSQKDDSPLSIIERADKVLYQAKENGRDRIIFD